MEKLHMRVDAHANTDRLDIPGDPQAAITIIPSSKIGLRIDQTDITSRYATHLRKAATKPAMMTRFRKHYGWDAKDAESVDWKAHHDAIHKLRDAVKKFKTKFFHQVLLMGAVFHKIDPTQSITCSSCKVHPECEAHLYQYPAHPSRGHRHISSRGPSHAFQH